ncbi:hypothetical protein Hanom_Chr03g00215051 [Helianthus anomalus]
MLHLLKIVMSSVILNSGSEDVAQSLISSEPELSITDGITILMNVIFCFLLHLPQDLQHSFLEHNLF